jgi:ureidoglycolate lyase
VSGWQTIPLEPLAAEAFAPFGALVRAAGPAQSVNDGYGHRYEVDVRPGPGGADLEPCLAVYTVWARPRPVRIARLERHPHTTQTFWPQAGGPYLVVVAPSDPVGRPAVAGARAFAADAGVGITYHPGVWHAGLTTLAGTATFAMLMWTGSAADTVFADLAPGLAIDDGQDPT